MPFKSLIYKTYSGGNRRGKRGSVRKSGRRK